MEGIYKRLYKDYDNKRCSFIIYETSVPLKIEVKWFHNLKEVRLIVSKDDVSVLEKPAKFVHTIKKVKNKYIVDCVDENEVIEGFHTNETYNSKRELYVGIRESLRQWGYHGEEVNGK